MMDIQTLIEMVFASLWIPIFVNVVIDGKYGKKRIVCTIIMILFYNIIGLCVGMSEISGISYLLLSMLTVYLTMGPSIWKVISVPAGYMVGVFCNYSAEIFFNDICSIDFIHSLYDKIYIGIMTLLVLFVSILVRCILKFFSARMQESIMNDMKFVILGNLALYTLVFLINGYAIRQMGYPDKMFYLTFAIFLVYGLLTLGITFLSFRGIQNKEKQKREEEVKKNLLEYTTQVESMYEGLRSFKHDYVNILAAMSGYLENEDMEGLKTYFNENILPTNEAINRENYHLQKLSKIQDPAMKGLISSKLIYAHSMGADVFVDIMDEVKPFAMRDVDATRVLGIYLDNAIEAALETKQKEIKFSIVCEAHSTTIVLINSFLDKGLPVEKMDQMGATTKGEGHGIGLSNVNEILKRYKNICKMTEIRDGYFVQTLMIGEK